MSDDRLSEEELAELREIFAHYDTNGDGVIERTEFVALLEALGVGSESEHIEAAIDAVDSNKNGVIEFEEFLAWWSAR